MRKVLIITLSVLAGLFLLALLLPLIFKDDIKKALDEQLAKNLTAKVYYDADNFSLSLLSNFPNMTVKLRDFGVEGQQQFQGDTLVQVKEFALVLNLMSVIKGDQIEVQKILLDSPKIYAIKLADGSANWNITKPDTAAPKPEEPKEPSKFNLAIRSWEIRNGEVGYLDLQAGNLANLHGLNHSGSGDFSNTIVDLATKTVVDSLTVELDSTRYFNKTRFEANMAVKLDQENNTISFGDNLVKLNDFGLAFSGTVQNQEAGPVLDVKFSSKDNSFKSLLSLVPAVFRKGYEDLKTEGTLSFDGFAKGQKQGDQLPTFGFNLQVVKAMLQYPKLPSAVTDVNLDLNVSHPGGLMDAIAVDLKKLHFQIGRNPFDARLKLKGLNRMELDGQVNSRLDLSEITQAFPVADMTLKGLLAMDIKAYGVYDAASKTLPSVAAKVEMMDGYVKSKAVPAPLEQLNFALQASVDNGNPETGKLALERLRFVFEGEPLEASATVSNFSNYTYQAALKGKADVGKLTKLFPLEGKELAGIIVADITTSGAKADVDAKRWDKLPTSGSFAFSNFSFRSTSLKQPVTITKGLMTFSPQKLNITECVGKLGSSDYSLNGEFSNYMAYTLADGTLKGNMTLTSPKFMASEWSSSDSEAKPASKPAESAQTTTAPDPAVDAEAISVPKNLDLVMSTQMGALVYDKYTLDQFTANMIIRNGAVTMEKLAFNAFDGAVRMNGSLDPTVGKSPAFRYAMDMNKLSIPKTYQTVSAAKQMTPFLEKVTGLFGGKLDLKGNLTPSLGLDMKGITGTAIISLNQAALNNLDFTTKVNGLTKLNLPTQYQLNDQQIQATIQDGFVNFKPFDIGSGANKVGVSGRYGLDGTLDYNLKVQVPSGAAGQLAGQALSSFLGGRSASNLSNLVVDIKVGGTYDKPSYRIANVGAAGAGGGATNTVKQIANDAANQAKAEAERRAREEADRLKRDAEERARQEADRLKKEAENKAKEELQKLKNRFRF